MVAGRESGSTPRPCVKLACGSKSTRITLRPSWDSPTPTLIVVVVLPTPPFWFATAITRGMTAASCQQASRLASRRAGRKGLFLRSARAVGHEVAEDTPGAHRHDHTHAEAAVR